MDEISQKSILTYQIIVLVVLVVLDKGTSLEFSNGFSFQKSNYSFKNSMINLPEITEDPMEVGTNQKKFSKHKTTQQGIYFLKFNSRGKHVTSSLVKVSRTLKGSLKKRVWKALEELAKGPTGEEESKGVISGLPPGFEFTKKIRLQDGTLHITLPEEFEENTGKDLMKDRIDQLVYTLMEFPEVKGVKLNIEGKNSNYLGSDNLNIPGVLVRTERRVLKIEREGF
jgi:spore germination protein GerM